MSSTLIDARLNKSDNGRSHHFKGPRTVANGLTGIKTRWWSGCSLSIGTEYTRCFQVSPTDKNRKCLMSDEREGCTSKISACGQILTRTLSLFWCKELTPEICSGSFEYAMYAFLWLVSEICVMVNIIFFFYTFHPLVLDIITEEINCHQHN
jgi:hypothetical protein